MASFDFWRASQHSERCSFWSHAVPSAAAIGRKSAIKVARIFTLRGCNASRGASPDQPAGRLAGWRLGKPSLATPGCAPLRRFVECSRRVQHPQLGAFQAREQNPHAVVDAHDIAIFELCPDVLALKRLTRYDEVVDEAGLGRCLTFV